MSVCDKTVKTIYTAHRSEGKCVMEYADSVFECFAYTILSVRR